MIESALELVEKGFKIFPCAPRKKLPLIPKDKGGKGVYDATDNVHQIRVWWGQCPNANIAAAVPETHVVIDLDPASEKQKLEGMFGHVFPPTISTATPRAGGGVHLWYELPRGVTVSNKVRPYPGMDVRSFGGYAMMPPSVHPSGGIYQWKVKPESFSDIEIAPDWLVNILQSGDHESTFNKADKIDPSQILAGVAEGKRDITIFRFICSCYAKGYDIDITKTAARAAAQASNWTERDTDKMVENVYNNSRYNKPNKKEEIVQGWRLDELMEHSFDRESWIIEPIMKKGITILSSDPKRGKSTLIQNFCKSVSDGQLAFNQFKTTKSGVLVLDLEQVPGEAQERWEAIFKGQPYSRNVHVYFKWPRSNEGGLDLINRFLKLHPDVNLVVIDTWAKFTSGATPKEAQGLNSYYAEYAKLDEVEKIAKEFDVAIVLVHHFSKNSKVKGPSGTQAMSGEPAGVWNFNREQGSKFATLECFGKNIPETRVNFVIKFDEMDWTIASIE